MGLKSKKKILLVFEGERAEKQIIQNLNLCEIIKDDVFLYAFCADIYQFYDKIKSYYFEELDEATYDIFTDLKNLDTNKNLKEIKRKEISGIYLFFDYDGHSNYANDDKVVEMLKFFDEETENGKLFISYPMVESIKHIQEIKDFKETSIKCRQNINYKKIVSENCNKKYIQINKYDKAIWKELITAHLYKMNYIINDDYSYPSQIYSQLEIFEKQKEKFIDRDNTVSVLSAFPIFIHDYFGNEKTKNNILNQL